MNKRDQEEFANAEGADRVSNVDQSENAKRADLFEELYVSILKIKELGLEDNQKWWRNKPKYMENQ